MRLTPGYKPFGKHRQKLSNTFCGKKAFILLLIFVISFSIKSYSQTASDTIEYHSAKKASIMSACLPGLGQAYNKKYWKIPIIYTGFGVFSYFIVKNGTEYRNFREAYNIVANEDTANYDNPYVVRYEGDLTSLQEGRNYYRHNLELTYILTGLLYVLDIIDASVDANLYNFDVSDELSLQFEPVSNQLYWAKGPTPGITLKFRF